MVIHQGKIADKAILEIVCYIFKTSIHQSFRIAAASKVYLRKH
jgi:hypothetical protein